MRAIPCKFAGQLSAGQVRHWHVRYPIPSVFLGAQRRHFRKPCRRPFSCQASAAGTQHGSRGTTNRDDEIKELSRVYRRTVFGFSDWQDHRSNSRYWRHMVGMLSSRMVRGLTRPLLYVVSVATAVALYETGYEARIFPALLPDLELHSREPFQLTSFALSLLLVFRTNASYSRWLRTRKTWGLILNRSRDIVRQGISWIPQERVALRRMLYRWVPAFSKTLMCHLRHDRDVEQELKGLLRPYELQELLLAEHRPNYVLQVLSTVIRTSRLPSSAARRMDENLTQLEDCLGTCERILDTPIPLSYTRHTSRYMMIWLTLLPFTLWDNCGWAIVPLCTLIGFLLIGIEEIGVSIEEPFSILPLESICDSISKNILELQETHGGDAGAALGAAAGGQRRPASANAMIEVAVVEDEGAEALPRNGIDCGLVVVNRRTQDPVPTVTLGSLGAAGRPSEGVNPIRGQP